MKKLYEEPQFDIERFAFQDIITASGLGGEDNGSGDGDFSGDDQVIPGL